MNRIIKHVKTTEMRELRNEKQHFLSWKFINFVCSTSKCICNNWTNRNSDKEFCNKIEGTECTFGEGSCGLGSCYARGVEDGKNNDFGDLA